MGPRNQFQGMNSASLCSLAGQYDKLLPPWFLAPIDSLKIPALICVKTLEPNISSLGHFKVRLRFSQKLLLSKGWTGQPDLSSSLCPHCVSLTANGMHWAVSVVKLKQEWDSHERIYLRPDSGDRSWSCKHQHTERPKKPPLDSGKISSIICPTYQYSRISHEPSSCPS
jgi:hypothetical protein